MYEARQNKEKVSRRIDEDGRVRQKMRMKNNSKNEMLHDEENVKIDKNSNMPHTLQRLIIGIEELSDEAVNSSFEKYKAAYPTETAIRAANMPTNIRGIRQDEKLMIIGHGSEAGLGLYYNEFCHHSPLNLAKLVAPMLPDKYKEEIYLNGCYTGQRGSLIKKSYIEYFGDELKNLRSDITINIKGNVGVAFISQSIEKQAGMVSEGGVTYKGKTTYGASSNVITDNDEILRDGDGEAYYFAGNYRVKRDLKKIKFE